VQQKNKRLSKPTNNDKSKTKRNTVIFETQDEQAAEKICDEEKHSEASHKLETFSEEDLSEFLEKSIMEDADFHELRYQPLQVQLERLFGEEADGYLNPTVKESPRKVFDLGIAKKSKLILPGFCQPSILCFSSKSCKPLCIFSEGQHGAAALWEALRAYSRQKLVHKDALILPDVKVHDSVICSSIVGFLGANHQHLSFILFRMPMRALCENVYDVISPL
jgi:hypothetical protein